MMSTAKLLYCYRTDTVGRKWELARSSKKIGAAVGISRTAVTAICTFCGKMGCLKSCCNLPMTEEGLRTNIV